VRTSHRGLNQQAVGLTRWPVYGAFIMQEIISLKGSRFARYGMQNDDISERRKPDPSI